jgi:hypothetical protein
MGSLVSTDSAGCACTILGQFEGLLPEEDQEVRTEICWKVASLEYVCGPIIVVPPAAQCYMKEYRKQTVQKLAAKPYTHRKLEQSARVAMNDGACGSC